MSTSDNMLANNRYVRASRDVSGNFSQISPAVVISPGMPVYLHIHYNGAGIWRLYFGDGWTYNLLVAYPNFAFTPQSFGFQFVAATIASSYVQHMALIDFCRYTTITTPQHLPTS